MANTVKIKRSAVSGAKPTLENLALGELALNTYDGYLFTKVSQPDEGYEYIAQIGRGDATGYVPYWDLEDYPAGYPAQTFIIKDGQLYYTGSDNNSYFPGATSAPDLYYWSLSGEYIRFEGAEVSSGRSLYPGVAYNLMPLPSGATADLILPTVDLSHGARIHITWKTISASNPGYRILSMTAASIMGDPILVLDKTVPFSLRYLKYNDRWVVS